MERRPSAIAAVPNPCTGVLCIPKLRGEVIPPKEGPGEGHGIGLNLFAVYAPPLCSLVDAFRPRSGVEGVWFCSSKFIVNGVFDSDARDVASVRYAK